MPKPSLKPEFRSLEHDMIATLKAGLAEWRPDLSGPESTSDWQGAVRGLLKMYVVERRPIGLSDRDIVDPEEYKS